MKAAMRKSMQQIMQLSWQFIKRNGYSKSEALHTAWLNFKLRAEMTKKIVKFYYKKVDGTLREAFGTLKEGLIPAIGSNDNRRKNDTLQVCWDTEKVEWRCFKKANVLVIA